MELGELLAEFRREDLVQAVVDIRKFVSREDPYYKFKSQNPSKIELIEYFEYRTTLWDETAAVKWLRKINETNILIENPTHVPIAIILAFLPTDMLEQVAQTAKVDISDKPSAWRGAFSRTVAYNVQSFVNRNNTPHWFLVSKLAEFAAKSSKEYGINSFCPNCQKDNPKEADHCMSCGRELPHITCLNCETTNPPQAKFCMSCGKER